METINIRDCFPVMNGGDGVIVSKRGDVCVGWEVTLPAAFRCNEEGYDALLGALAGAIGLLPEYTVVHKQDVFMRKVYEGDTLASLGMTRGGFLEEAYERHFDGRAYLDHKCRIWLCFSTRKHVHGGTSGVNGIAGSGLPTAAVIGRCLQAAEQFGVMVGAAVEMRKLREEDLFGETPDQVGGDGRVGIMQDYLNFTDEGEDVLQDMQVAADSMVIGGKRVVCHLLADLDQLPGEVASCRRVSELSTEHSSVMLSYLNELGQGLECEHVVNWFCVKEPEQELHGRLDTKRRRMQSMSGRNARNRKYAEEIGEYLETVAVEQMRTVRCHISMFSTDEHATTSAISRMGITPVIDRANVPAQFWASIPGNESGLAYSEYMTMDLRAGLCLGLYDGFEPEMPGGVMKMSERMRLVPQRFDIQEMALEAGLMENYNVFLLGPTGAGKSFFMNKYLRSCYVAGQQCFLMDQGHSYRALCHIIREESGGKDGMYYTFEKGKPISFNPFRNYRRFFADAQAMDFLYTLMCVLWRNGGEVSAAEMKFVKESVVEFLRYWEETLRQAQGDRNTNPVFDDYYVFVRDVYRRKLEEERVEKAYFDMKGYLLTLEQFYADGPYGYLLNSRESVDILRDRFVVFEIDRIKDDKVVYPITTLVIMDAFNEKMSSTQDFKVMCIEEAWKALMGTQMATYMLELWKTARKHRTSAIVVTQELKDIVSSPIIRDTIVENSGVKILLDQTKYLNRFEELAGMLSLNEWDKGLVLSLNRMRLPVGAGNDGRPPIGSGGTAGREVFFNLGNRKSFVMRLEVSPEERWAFSSAKKDKLRLEEAVEACGGSYIEAIKKLVKEGV